MSPRAKIASQLQIPVSAKQLPVTNPDNVATVYANNIGISATMLDFTLYFVETGQLPGEKGLIPNNKLKSAVTLPLATAMALTQALNSMLKNAKEMSEKQQAAIQAMRKASSGAPQ
jgi:hypothetical protein